VYCLSYGNASIVFEVIEILFFIPGGFASQN
jgi:hypothetical protein